ncbi:MAG: hypothetical protein AAF479_10505 [Pseudomonadota bacterium]
MSDDLRYFAIFGAMRTGSNLLEKTLEALGDTVCYGEAFNPSFIRGPRKEDILGYSVETRDADPIGFLDAMIGAEPDRIAGFRIFPGHSRAVMERALADPRCTPIILTRDPLESWISLNIARATGQWMLKNPRRRMSGKAHFEPAAFEKYKSELAAYYAWVDAMLDRHGRSAVRIRYEEVQDQACLQRVARLIGSTGTVPPEAPILRQNSQSMADKVTNYAEMCAYLGVAPEERKEGPGLSPELLICPEHVPAAFIPLPGPAFAPVIALMHRIDTRDFGAEKLAPPELFDRANRRVLYPIEHPGERPVFTVISHPLVRLHRSFVHEVFGAGWLRSEVRKRLSAQSGGIPRPRAIGLGQVEFTDRDHQSLFSMFLRMVARSWAQGDDLMRLDWNTQTELLDLFGMRETVQVFRFGNFEDCANWMTDLASVPRFAPGQIKGMRQSEQQKLLPIKDVMVPEIEAQVRVLHESDFHAFGYD